MINAVLFPNDWAAGPASLKLRAQCRVLQRWTVASGRGRAKRGVHLGDMALRYLEWVSIVSVKLGVRGCC